MTAPYRHDGSVATLGEVVDIDAAGGRNVTEGPRVGDGGANPHKSSLVRGFTLTFEEKADLLAFLERMTDETFLKDPWVSK